MKVPSPYRPNAMKGLAPKDLEIIYVGDPMCSWCWGFAPVVEKLLVDYQDIADLSLILGGLWPGDASIVMNDDNKAVMRSHWEKVEGSTGQPFDYSFFGWKNFLYDTEPAARAVVTVRAVAPEKAYLFFKSLQEAFYARALDITRKESYLEALDSQGIDQAQFMDHFEMESTREATYADFSKSSDLGVTGFPSVLLRRGEELRLLSAGYRSYEHLVPALNAYFELT